MALRFQLLDSVTHGPKPPNEDAHGATPHTAWVIDGATGVTLGPDILAPSGAAWLAETLTATLHEIAPARPALDLMLADAQEAVSQRFEAAIDRDRVLDAPDLPTGCLGLAHVEEDRLHFAVIGDISLMHWREGGVVSVLTDPAVEALGLRTLEALRAARRERPDEDPWPALRLQIRENRRLANQPGGYNVVHPRIAWAHRVVTATAEARDGDIVLLASDGFFRLVDHFEMHDAAGLVRASLELGLAELVARLRRLETEDAAAIRAPRVKVHDDATALLLRVVG